MRLRKTTGFLFMVIPALMIGPMLMIGMPASRAEDACAGATRYQMPEGVETSGTTPGVAPADLPGSRSGYKLPRKLYLDLAVNPAGSAYDPSGLYLGQVEIDRGTGRTELDGKRLSGPADAEAACAGARSRPGAKTQP